ncbi:hypothetical protein AAMO2058_001375400 [Amorphochlora amoebiformis]
MDGKKVGMFGGALGSSVVTKMAVTHQNKDFAKIKSPNPMAPEDVKSLEKSIKSYLNELSIPPWLSKAISEPKIGSSEPKSSVISIGGYTCAFSVCQLATKANPFSAFDIRKSLKALVTLTDTEIQSRGLPQPTMVIPKMVLVLSVMDTLRIPEVYYFKTNGSTKGVVITSELWTHSNW